eukprot:Skav210142  [mRNA]  locus=scaffold268:34075:34275:+ [translate_table: standard]
MRSEPGCMVQALRFGSSWATTVPALELRSAAKGPELRRGDAQVGGQSVVVNAVRGAFCGCEGIHPL